MIELLLSLHKDLSLIHNVNISNEGTVLCFLKLFLNFSQNQVLLLVLKEWVSLS